MPCVYVNGLINAVIIYAIQLLRRCQQNAV